VDATNNNNTVAGSFSYNFASGTVLPAGTVNLVASFTPTDQATYANSRRRSRSPWTRQT
jgi:hypothetical protein